MRMTGKKRVLLEILAALVLSGMSTPARAVDPDADFQARCNAPGVIKCIGFDNTTSDIVQNVNLFPDGAGVFRASLDTTTKASGAGSLRFALPPPPTSGANIAGRWTLPTGWGMKFGQNSTFYVQFRQRLSPEMLNNTWDSYWKAAIFHQDNLTCASIELTTINLYLTGVTNMYSDCGGKPMTTELDGMTWKDASPPYLEQQGDYHCQYGNLNQNDCFYYVPNEWLTFYYEVHIGTWNQPNSTVRAWAAREGQPYKQFINVVNNLSLSCNTDPCDQSPGKDQGYNNVTLLPYMTGLNPNSGLAGVTSYDWYDELIISMQPIQAPQSILQSPTVPGNLTVH
ncbi:MAG TPA: hypothetical protein VKK81_15090 [Candidatus Binatia bacterium]|nr:hypothetical protein [Candidatus Binatia bacterium]